MSAYTLQVPRQQENCVKLLPYFNSNIKLLGLPQKVFNSPREIDICKLSGMEKGLVFDKVSVYVANLWFFNPDPVQDEDGNITEETLEETRKKHIKAFCFAPFVRDSHPLIAKGFRYVAYKFKIDFSKSYPALSKFEVTRWIKLCQAYKLLPRSIDAEQIWKTSSIILKYADLKPNQLYVYLSSVRYIQEAPHFIRSVLYLHDTLGVDFYISLVVASKYVYPSVTIGHHILPIHASTSLSGLKSKDPKPDLTDKIDLRFANAFRIFIESMATSGKTIEEIVACKGNISFTVHSWLFTIIQERINHTTMLMNTKLKDIRTDYVKAAVYSG